jgi:hypothetical protein
MAANKFDPAATLLLVDSNILYTKNQIEIVHKEFLADLAECRRYQRVQLLIPKVVISEIIFQKVIFAAGLIADAAKALKTLSHLTQSETVTVEDYKLARRKIQRRMIKWCKNANAIIVPTPTASINWESLIEAAIWHLPPFSPVENKSEKGFKDALILEVVSAIWAGNDHNNIVFVSGDKLLRDAAGQRHAKVKSLAVYEQLSDYISYLKLIAQKAAQEFANTVLEKAPKVFFDPDSEESVFNKLDLRHRIEKDFQFLLQVPPKPPETLLFLSSYSRERTRFIPVSDTTVSIGKTTFEKIDEEGYYNWKSEVSFAKLFSEEKGIVSYGTPRELIHIHTFPVAWRAHVSTDGNFGNYSVPDIALPTIRTEIANPMLLAQYELPSIVERWFAKYLSKESSQPE